MSVATSRDRFAEELGQALHAEMIMSSERLHELTQPVNTPA